MDRQRTGNRPSNAEAKNVEWDAHLNSALANQDPIESATLRPGTTFTPYAKDGPRTHKASNVWPTPFHNISFIFNSPQPSGFTPGTRGTGYVQVMDNERARGWRLVLESGQSTPAITQAAPGIRETDSGELSAAGSFVAESCAVIERNASSRS
jgi:hypothetical protein